MSENREFISRTSAAKMLGVTEVIMKRMGKERLVGTQVLPGMPTRYRAEDIKRLRERCTVPAMAETEVQAGQELACV